MAENYAVRAEQRISAHHTCLYHREGFHGKGHRWDLVGIRLASHAGPPVTQGMVMPVYIELTLDGEESRYVWIESAIARWSSGHDAGREIRTIDATSRARLNRFLDQLREWL